MSAWLKSILEELRMLDNAAVAALEPERETTPEEHVVGVISEETRKIYVISTKSFARSCEARSALLLLRGEARSVKLHEYAYFHEQADAIEEIFWMSCRHEFPELCVQPSIGIRKGWKVVWFEQEEKEQSQERPPVGMIPVFVPVGIPIRNQPPNTDNDDDSGDPDKKKKNGPVKGSKLN